MLALMQSGIAHADEGGVPLHGFADVVYGSTTGDSATTESQTLRGFSMGNIDIYLNPEFDGGVKSLIEIALEPDTEGAIAVDVERTQVGYNWGDNTVWFGRFHTPYGLWNTSYHHGGQLQMTVYRPRFLDFEDRGGLLPSHSVGAWYHGITEAMGGKVIVDAYAVNGPRIIDTPTGTDSQGTLNYNLIKGDKGSQLVGGNVSYKFASSSALEGLQLGVHAFQASVNSYADANYSSARINGTDVMMTGGYLNYEKGITHVTAEFYNFENQNHGTGATKSNSTAYFVQADVNMGSYSPYAMYEKADLDSSSNYFAAQASGVNYERSTVGVRYDVNSAAAAKLQWMTTSDLQGTTEKTSYDSIVAQYAIRF